MDEKIDTLVKEGRVIQPTARTKAAAHIQDYDQAYKASIADVYLGAGPVDFAAAGDLLF